MKALITGASSGIGYDMALYLDQLGIDLILVARDKDKLNDLGKVLKVRPLIIPMDLSKQENCLILHDMVKDESVDILINNAGFGVFGEFGQTDLNRELEMINLNIKAVHILTKLFLHDMKKKNSGYILNVASSAGFQPGPLMATYYATKSYVIKLTMAIYEELRQSQSKVIVSTLCPGPVDTNFNKVANVSFGIKALSSEYVAKYAIDQMFKNKLIIIPGFYMKVAYYLGRFVPSKLLLKVTYDLQKRKTDQK